MWQVLLAAAVAGSGILARRLIINANAAQPISVPSQNDHKCDQLNDPQSSNESLQPQDSVFLGNDVRENTGEVQCETQSEGSIFRFSSTSGAEMSSKTVRKKTRGGFKGIRGKTEGLKENSNGKAAKKCGVFGCEKRGWVVDQRGGGNGKRVSVCLKKRRTSKITYGKCQSCTSKANSLFSWGLSVGMMYMMSAGKAEINRLNNAMDETSKIVQELKAELSRRKIVPNLYISNVPTIGIQPKNNREMLAESVVKKSISEKGDAVKVFALPIAEEGECTSSVLTEEPQPEAFEMDQLETELETELQKLPWSAMECSGFEERVDTFELDVRSMQRILPFFTLRLLDYRLSQKEVSAREFHQAGDGNLYSQQSNGVLPSELDQKLCHLLIEQQESQIVELESELHRTNSKLYEKETELQTLKDCVRRLTEFSLGSASDEETDVQVEGEKISLKDQVMEMGPDSGRPLVGVKRAADFES